MSQLSPDNQHYVPRFLLRNWAFDLSKKKVWRGANVYNERYEVKENSIEGTCSADNFYTKNTELSFPKSLDEYLQKKFETPGAIVVKKIVEAKSLDISPEDKKVFSELVISFFYRNPTAIAKAKDEFSKLYLEYLKDTKTRKRVYIDQDGIPFTRDEITPDLYDMDVWQNGHIDYIERLLNPEGNPYNFNALMDMKWALKTINVPTANLILSDIPTITIGQTAEGGGVILPLSPKIAFIASGSDEWFAETLGMQDLEFIFQMNMRSAAQSANYIVSVDKESLLPYDGILGAKDQKTVVELYEILNKNLYAINGGGAMRFVRVDGLADK